MIQPLLLIKANLRDLQQTILKQFTYDWQNSVRPKIWYIHATLMNLHKAGTILS